VITTHVPLGQVVLKKEVIFLDLAIAQAAALGVIFAQVLNISFSSFLWHSMAVIRALVMAELFQYLEIKKIRLL
jgi:zinc/manganese transport system permease protein